MAYELADGTVKEYPYGLARIEFMGEMTAGQVILVCPMQSRFLALQPFLLCEARVSQ